MRCHICDKQLSEKEGAFNKDLGQREPCSFCLEIALDAAYSDGFQNEDDDNVILIGEESEDDRIDLSSLKDFHAIGGLHKTGEDE